MQDGALVTMAVQVTLAVNHQAEAAEAPEDIRSKIVIKGASDMVEPVVVDMAEAPVVDTSSHTMTTGLLADVAPQASTMTGGVLLRTVVSAEAVAFQVAISNNKRALPLLLMVEVTLNPLLLRDTNLLHLTDINLQEVFLLLVLQVQTIRSS